MGISEVECVVLDLDSNKEKALNMALNKIDGEFDIPLLTDLLKDLSGSDDVFLLKGNKKIPYSEVVKLNYDNSINAIM